VTLQQLEDSPYTFTQLRRHFLHLPILAEASQAPHHERLPAQFVHEEIFWQLFELAEQHHYKL